MTIVMGMTVQEAINLARARVAELGASIPGTTSLMIQRASQMQQRVFALAAQWNPDYFGTCVVGTLDAGRVDLMAILDPNEIVETVTRVEVADAGSSTTLVAGDEVTLVTLSDPSSAIPPRALLRRKVLAGYAADLTGVVSLRVFYSPSPLPLPLDDLDKCLEIPRPHDAIVSLDLTLYLIDKLPATTPSLDLARAQVQAEAANALAAFERHVRSYAIVSATRFGSAPHSPPVRAANTPPTD